MEIVLYHRPYCHLCEEMAQALAPIAAETGLVVRMVDVDSDPALEERYGLAVPVLVHEGAEVCRYRLDAAAVRAVVAAKRARH
ncbi:MAG: glutaredoxin family protein [Acidiferrobacter sp.]